MLNFVWDCDQLEFLFHRDLAIFFRLDPVLAMVARDFRRLWELMLPAVEKRGISAV